MEDFEAKKGYIEQQKQYNQDAIVNGLGNGTLKVGSDEWYALQKKGDKLQEQIDAYNRGMMGVLDGEKAITAEEQAKNNPEHAYAIGTGGVKDPMEEHMYAIGTGGVKSTQENNPIDNFKDVKGKWIEGAADDAREWVSNAAQNTGEWVNNAAQDVGNWFEGAAKDTGGVSGNYNPTEQGEGDRTETYLSKVMRANPEHAAYIGIGGLRNPWQGTKVYISQEEFDDYERWHQLTEARIRQGASKGSEMESANIYFNQDYNLEILRQNREWSK